MAIEGFGNHIGQLDGAHIDDAQDAPAAAPSQAQPTHLQDGLEQSSDPSHASGPPIADTDLKEIAGNIVTGNIEGHGQQHDASPSKDLIRGNDFQRMHAARTGGVSEGKKSDQPVKTHEQAHAERNELFKARWAKIKKQGESSEIDTDKMDELHNFEALAKNASFETIQNIASLMSFMHGMKNNPVVQKTGTLVEQATNGLIQKRTAEKIIRTVPHIVQAMALSLDPDTKKMAAGGFRLALTPKLVEGDEEAGKKGLETKEVRLLRDAIRRTLKDNGFNPNTGELVDQEKIKSIAQATEEARNAATERQREFFLNGWDALSPVKKDDSLV